MPAKKTPVAPTTPPPVKPSALDVVLEWFQRAEVIGVLLVLAALFTLLSLITGSRGALTGAWIDFLRSLFGSGVWFFPIGCGGLGVWIVMRVVEKLPELPWMRPVGVAVLLVAYSTASALIFPLETRLQLTEQGGAGGAIGFWVATGLQQSLTLVGAWFITFFLFLAGIIFLSDQWLINVSALLYIEAMRWARREPIWSRQVLDPTAPPLPLGEIPWWRRWAERLRLALTARRESYDEPIEQEAGALAQPPLPRRVDPARPTQSVITATPSATSNAQNAAAGVAQTPGDEPELPPMRIIGGAQEWRLPKLSDMLQDWERRSESDDRIRQQGRLIQETLELFGVPADFEGAYKGPSVTQYLIKPGYVERNIKGEQQRIKVKVAKIAALANDLALALAASSVRIEAPIPGTNYVGVEVPNQESNVVGVKELMESETFTNMKGRLKIALGEDVKGQPICTDLARMPHLLIAGATGSGKSVCVNAIIACLLLTHTPDTLRLLMVDPKMVELSVYNGIPHLLSPVVTEVDKAAAVLFWAVKEMERRYSLCSKVGARDIVRYNDYLSKRNEKPLPYIVVVVDEMADLMMAAPEEVEKHICRLAQMARAVGIHLIIATQRPSVDVITGLIKANFPSRIAFAVTSQTDSRVILDVPGAERLLGRGDMLFMAPDASKLERLQGAWLSDDEINKLVRYWKGVRTFESPAAVPWETVALDPTAEGNRGASTEVEPDQNLTTADSWRQQEAPVNYDQVPLLEEAAKWKAEDGRDPLYEDAVRVVREAGRGSISLLQRELRVGYGRAARLIEQLEAAGILGPDQGNAQGRVLLDPGPSPTRPRIIGGDDSTRPGVWM